MTRRLLRDRLGEAVAARAALGLGDGGRLGAGGEERTDCYRLVNSEGDGGRGPGHRPLRDGPGCSS